jgi:hypothetical protein
MFGFVQWDNPVALVLEVVLSIAVVASLFMVVRRVNARAAAEQAAREKSQAKSTDQPGA